jgi:hypothetical protein
MTRRRDDELACRVLESEQIAGCDLLMAPPGLPGPMPARIAVDLPAQHHSLPVLRII